MMLHNVEYECKLPIHTAYTNIIDKHAMEINNDYALYYETNTNICVHVHTPHVYEIIP